MSGQESILADDIRQKCSDLAGGLIRDSGLAAMFYRSMIRKMRMHPG
jgi:hypothetical protein